MTRRNKFKIELPEVGNSLWNNFFCGAREVQPTHNAVERNGREHRTSVGKHVNQTGMRACRKDKLPLVFYMHRNKSFIHDEGVRSPGLAVIAPAKVARKSRFILGETRDLTTNIKRPASYKLGLARIDDVGARVRERIRIRHWFKF